jgi:hypothetical protein
VISSHYGKEPSAGQAGFFVGELAEPFDVLLMLSAAPVLWEGHSGLKFRDLVVEFSRWVLGPKVLSTVDHHLPLLVREK